MPAPQARKTGLLVERIDGTGEVVVYDLATDRAHSLNASAARIWQLCDGARSAEEIAALLGEGTAPETVAYGVGRLRARGLLSQGSDGSGETWSRRRLVRKIGLAAAIALPAIASITAPTPAMAASCLPLGGTGCPDTPCCSASCVGGVCVCFASGTLVARGDGHLQPIETICAGDFVLSRCDRSGAIAPRRVDRLFIHEVHEPPLVVTLTSGEAVRTTPNHPVRAGECWLPAGRLAAGARCVVPGGEVTVASCRRGDEPVARVYNLHVAEYHTYFVGNARVWVHNK